MRSTTDEGFLLKVHELLNSTWEGVFRLNRRLRDKIDGNRFQIGDVEPIFNGYIHLKGEWRIMRYPYPGFEISPNMEVGATLQGYYFVIAVPVEKLNESLIESFLSLSGEHFIYGAVDFLRDFYGPSSNDEPREVLRKIKTSEESTIQMESDYETPAKLEDDLLRFIEICEEFGVFELER